MKIMAQSLVPVNPMPYMHLGYIAAADINQRAMSMPHLFLLSAIGLVVLFGTFKTRLRYAGIAICLLFIASGIVAYWHSEKLSREKRSGVKTYILQIAIMDHVMKGETIPDNFNEMQKRWGLSPDANLDYWSHELRVRKEKIEGKAQYRVESAGEDGVFDTSDDIYTSGSYGGRKNWDHHREW